MSSVFDEKSPLLSQIGKIAASIPGWTPEDQLFTLYLLVMATGNMDGDILEIGSWCGRSTTILALAARLRPGTKIHAIDLFPSKEDWVENKDGSYSFNVFIPKFGNIGGYFDQTVWKEPFERDIAPVYRQYNSVYDAFVDSVERHGVGDIVKAYRGDSRCITDIDGLNVRLAFVDGDHSYTAVCQDIEQIERVLLPGGWLCFDDSFSYYDGVNQAIIDKVINSTNYDSCQQMTRKMFVARRREVAREN
jgi:hypothetical protein